MNPIIDLLKTFFEKGFIKTLISLASAGVVFSFTPNDFFMIDKLSKIGYFCLLFIALFLLVEITYRLLKLLSKVAKLFFKAFLYAIKQERKTKEMWNVLDKIDYNEREIIIDLLKTENEPISFMFRYQFTQYVSDWIEEKHDYSTNCYYYCLKDEAYRLLKSSLNSYIKKSRKKQTNEEMSK